jgi:hypothetical protein
MTTPFHGSRIETGTKPFRNMRRREREQLKADATNVIVSSGIIGIGVGVELEAFNRVVTGKAREFVGDPYIMCFQAVMVEVVRHSLMFIGEKPEEGIVYIFDSQPTWQREANEMWIKMIERGFKDQYRLGSVAFKDDKDYIVLQAADHLSYETYRYMRERPIRPAMNRFMSWHQHHGRYFNEEGCRLLVEELRKNGKI